MSEAVDERPSIPAALPAEPLVVSLADPRAQDAPLVGAKAANLARAAAAGLAVLPGVVVTTGATERWAPGDPVDPAVLDALHAALAAAGLSDRRLVVRSSSTVEDADHSSLAGRFASVLDVAGREALEAAVAAVRDSAAHVVGPGGPAAAAPLAVLVQPQLPAVLGGVLFGLDPVQGDRRHVVAEVTAGNPSDLVSGRTTAVHLVLSRRGWRRSSSGDGPTLTWRRRREVARLAARTQHVFGQPQDVEWAVGPDGRLWVLQSRPVTAAADAAGIAGAGPVLGPGPVAETFPEPLRRLEVELWLAPVREGIRGALRLTGAVPARRLAASPLAVVVDGRAAVDLEVLGIRRARLAGWGPLAGLRRLRAAWRVGRLRTVLPAHAADLLAAVDDQLADVPPLSRLSSDELVTLLENTADLLAVVHGSEVLAGMLLADESGTVSAATVALSALTRAGAEARVGPAEVIAGEPVTLALVPPRFGGTRLLPVAPPAPLARTSARIGLRDALRLRTRWLQELGARAMAVLGQRLARWGPLDRPELVRELSIDELRRVVAGGPLPEDLDRRAARRPGPPLPAAFRLSRSGAVVALRPAAGATRGLPAGGPRIVGRIRHDPPTDHEAVGSVLVVPTLDPGLAPALPVLAGLVCETGSALSHLAILAREMGVATVVAVPDARRRFPAGARAVVDGRSGEVVLLGERDGEGGGTEPEGATP